MPPRKRQVDEITLLAEPAFSESQLAHFREGIDLFNSGSHWHAHEAWEHVWLEMHDGPEDNAEIVLRGLIQLAAAIHLLKIGRLDGAASNFRKSYDKLALAPNRFLGIDIAPLLEYISIQQSRMDPMLASTITPGLPL